MTQNKKTPTWITLPDEPDRHTAAKGSKRLEKVNNKAFWGSGLVAMIVFFSVLFLPAEYYRLLGGNLFDGGFQVVPDYDEQTAETEQQVTEEESEPQLQAEDSEEPQEPVNENVVEAENEPVSIQVDPIVSEEESSDEEVSDTEEEASAEEESGDDESMEKEMVDEAEGDDSSQDDSEEEAGSEPEAEPSQDTEALEDDTETEEAPDETDAATDSSLESELDANRQLLAELSKQLAELKSQNEESEEEVRNLRELLEEESDQEDETDDLRPVAGSSTTTTTIPVTTQQPISQPSPTGTTPYRFNTHTVQVSPYQVLQQNRQAQQAAQQHLVQANVGAASSTSSSYNAQFAGAQGTPETGPRETLILAFIAAIGLYSGWKLIKGFAR
jgi:hypothetical protein